MLSGDGVHLDDSTGRDSDAYEPSGKCRVVAEEMEEDIGVNFLGHTHCHIATLPHCHMDALPCSFQPEHQLLPRVRWQLPHT